MDSKRILIVASVIAFIALLLVASFYIEVPYTIRSRALFMPASEYNLVRTADGNLISSFKDNIKGVVKSYGVTEFQRGDVVQFLLNPKMSNQKYVQAGDTIGWIVSNEEQRNLIQLKGELNILKAEMAFYTTGQKPEDIQTAKEQLELAKEQLDIQKKLLKRSVALFKDSVIPQQDYDIELNKLKVKEIEVGIAEARYLSITTGEKKEQERLVAARISNLESQIQQVSNRLAYFTFTTPLSGIILLQRENEIGENVIAIGDTSHWVGVIPVQLKERDFIKLTDTIAFKELKGNIVGIDNSVKIIDRKQSFYVTGVWPYKDNIMPGTLAEVDINCPKVSIKDYFLRLFKPAMGM
jgi:multidrug efflux pump subunit AcrA (membrane-fusion protein)